jgi:predicted nuclease of predicted toxin-antitoxin system
MKLLLDTCVWGKAVDELTAAGHDVIWAGAWTPDPGDEEILKRAHDEARILVTLDKDFGELVIVHGHSHSGIVRIVNISARQQARTIDRVVKLYGNELQAGAVVTVEAGRVRIRPPENPTSGGTP